VSQEDLEVQEEANSQPKRINKTLEWLLQSVAVGGSAAKALLWEVRTRYGHTKRRCERCRWKRRCHEAQPRERLAVV